jgi:S-formylglutathione hydrolase FrmB
VTTSLLDARVPIPLAVAGAGLVWAGRGRASLPKLAAVFAGTLASVVAVGRLVRVQDRVGSSFPPSFFLWAALPVFAFAVACLPRHAHDLRRWAAVAGAVALLLFGGGEVNAHYGYRPSVGDLLGTPLPDASGRPVTTAATPAPVALPGRQHGALQPVVIRGRVSGFVARPALVWLPPAWAAERPSALPVVMLLGGVPGEPADLIRAAGAVDIADRYAAAHRGMAPILVFADENGGYLNDSECVDGPRGNAETYLTRDVRDAVIARFGASSEPSQWAVAGYSEGGTCAVTLVLRHPDLFGSFVDVAGDAAPSVGGSRGGVRSRRRTVDVLFGGRTSEWRQHDGAALAPTAPPALRGWMVAGSSDRHAQAAAAELAAGFATAGADVQVLSEPGGHTFFLARRALEATLPPLSDVLLVQTAPSHPGPSGMGNVADAPSGAGPSP